MNVYFIILLLTLSALANSSSSSSQYVLSSYCEDGGSSVELVQVILFFRHGIYSPLDFFYDDEYAPYDLTSNDIETPTYLGLSQTWSMGKNLKEKYSDLLFDISTATEASFYISTYERSYIFANYFSSGLIGNYPDWSYNTISDIAINAIKTNGYCVNCPSEFALDIEGLAVSGYTNQTQTDESVFEVQDTEFFDIDDVCSYFVTNNEETTHVLGEWVETYLGITLTNEEIESLSYLMFLSYERHYDHYLPTISVDDDLVQYLIDNMDPDYAYFTDITSSAYQLLFDEEKFMAKLFDSSILESITENLYGYKDEPKKLVTYLMHDNNMYGLLQLTKDDQFDFPDYASSIEFVVYKETTIDGSEYFYVNGFYNAEEFFIAGCGYDCDLDEFYELMLSYIIDTDVYCN